MTQPYILNKLNLVETELLSACKFGKRNHATDIHTHATGTKYLMDITVSQKMDPVDPGLLVGSFILVISKGNAKIEIDEDDTIISFDDVIAKIRKVVSPFEFHVV